MRLRFPCRECGIPTDSIYGMCIKHAGKYRKLLEKKTYIIINCAHYCKCRIKVRASHKNYIGMNCVRIHRYVTGLYGKAGMSEKA